MIFRKFAHLYSELTVLVQLIPCNMPLFAINDDHICQIIVNFSFLIYYQLLTQTNFYFTVVRIE